MDYFALSMKAVTFLGVLAAATGMNLPSLEAKGFRAHLALGAVGVALMVANAWIASSPAAILADLGYAIACAVVLARAVRAGAARPMVLFEVVDAAPA